MSYILHTEKQAVVLNVDDRDKFLSSITGAVAFDKYVAAPHSVTATQQMRDIGLPIPSPIGTYYDWPKVNGIHTPLQHQKETAAFLTLNKRAYCLNEIGTQKTASTLYAADYLQRTGNIRRVLIISPLSTLEQVWADTTYFTFRDKSAAVLHGTAERRKKLFQQDHDFYIINHDALEIITDRKYEEKLIHGDKMNPSVVTARIKKLIDATLLRNDIDLIIIDELAEFRNYDTTKYAVLSKLIKPEHWVWGLTGTPKPKDARDVYAQCRLVTPWTVPKFFTMWRQMTMTQINQFRWEERPEANGIVANAMRPSILYRRDECLDLPPITYSGRDCKLTPEQEKHFKELMTELATEIKNGTTITAVNEGVKQSKLLQISCGVVYDKKGEEVVIKATHRLNTLTEAVGQCGQKVIVFVPFTHVLNDVAEHLRKDWTVEVVNGAVSKTQRDIIFNKFQKTRDPHVLVADARTMSHGLTLTEASTVIWYAPAPSNNVYEQANGRITRSGQKHSMNIINISASPMERRIYKRHQNQQSSQGVLLDLVKESMTGGV